MPLQNLNCLESVILKICKSYNLKNYIMQVFRHCNLKISEVNTEEYILSKLLYIEV